MKYVSKLMLLLLAVVLVSPVASAAGKKSKKKSTEPAAVAPTPTPVTEPAPLPSSESNSTSTSSFTSSSSSTSEDEDMISIGLGYLKTLGPIKDYTSSGLQYGVEWNRMLPVDSSGWKPHAGLTYRRAKLTGSLDGGGTATHTRTDYLVVYGYNFSGNSDEMGFFADGLLGLINRKLKIESGTNAIGDDFYSKTNLGLGFRGGLEIPFRAGDSKLVSRIGLGMLTGVSMPSGRLHYNQDTVDVNGSHLTLGADLGWLF